MIQRSGEVIIRMLSDVKQNTIKPINSLFSEGRITNIHCEYAIYNRLEE